MPLVTGVVALVALKHERRIDKGGKVNFSRTRKSLPLRGVVLMALLIKAGVVSAIEVGDKAPDFKLPATTGVDISLSDFRGKKFVLLEFYGAAFVPT